jgi:tRNA threonylcarbamoyladenosine biosynthesis protein TsaB
MPHNSFLPILAIECSGSLLSLAIQTDKGIFTHQQEGQRQHSLWILQKIKDLLDKADLSISGIKTIAVGNGPGSFIGVRLGHAVAQALCLPTQKKLITLSSLHIIAQSLLIKSQAQTIFVAQDARKNEVYACAYHHQNGLMQPILEEKLLTLEALQSEYDALSKKYTLTLIGTGWHAYQDQLSVKSPIANLAGYDLAKAALELAYSLVDTEHLAEPNYLRNHVADLPNAAIKYSD